MKKKNTIESLTHGEYLKVAVPFIISTVTQPLLGAVDTAVVGRLADPAYIAGVSVGTVIFNTLYWLFGFLRVSTTSYSAQAHGRDRNEDRNAALLRPAVIALAVGLCFVILQNPLFKAAMFILSPEKDVQSFTGLYFSVLIWGAPFVLINYVMLGWLMGQAKLKEALMMQISGNVLNILLDILFVHHFQMKVGGVAAATLISQFTAFILGLCFIWKSGRVNKKFFNLKELMDKRRFAEMMRVNSDLMIRTACLLCQINLFTATSAKYGTALLSANAILLQIQSVISYIFDGLANTSSVYSGKAIGQKEERLLKASWQKTGEWTGILIVIITPLYLLFRENLVLLFTDIEEVLILADKYGFWIAFYPALAGFGLTFYGVFTGTAATRPVRNSTIMALGLNLLVWAFMVPVWGNHGLWMSLLAFYFGRSIFLVPNLNKTKSMITNYEKGGNTYA